MIVVVADASPLNYLIQIGFPDLLSTLYQRILLPSAVVKELDHSATPVSVRAWLRHTPDWIEIRELRTPPDVSLAVLDPGEREAIQLAQENMPICC